MRPKPSREIKIAQRPEAWGTEAVTLFSTARDPKAHRTAVVAFHGVLDRVIDISVQGHGALLACRRGCQLCCSLQVQAEPSDIFFLGSWLRQRLTPAQLGKVVDRLESHVARCIELGPIARRDANVACALLGPEGECSVYPARPPQCRKFHSVQLSVCESSYANPADRSIASPEHPAVRHNAAVIIAQARAAARKAGLDAESYDLNGALLEALTNPRCERRWRDGKKAFTNPGARVS